MPLAGVLAAPPAAEYGVIEFDHYAGDVFDGIAQSYAHLLELGLQR